MEIILITNRSSKLLKHDYDQKSCMNPDMAYLKLLLNDIHVDLGIFQNKFQQNQDVNSSNNFIRISDFKERVSNLKNACSKCRLDFIRDDLERFVLELQNSNNFLSNNKEKIIQLRETAVILIAKISNQD